MEERKRKKKREGKIKKLNNMKSKHVYDKFRKHGPRRTILESPSNGIGFLFRHVLASY